MTLIASCFVWIISNINWMIKNEGCMLFYIQSLNVLLQSKKKMYLFIFKDCREKIFAVVTRSNMDQGPIWSFFMPPSQSFCAFKHDLNSFSFFFLSHSLSQTIPNSFRRISLKQLLPLVFLHCLLYLNDISLSVTICLSLLLI